MSARSTSLLGYGLYFIDVLACLLFCITLALVGARFGRERALPLDLPSLERSPQTGADLSGVAVSVRSGAAGPEIFYEEERVSFEELEARLRAAPPASIVVRSEASPLARVIALAHGAGVHDIELAYEAAGGGEEVR